MKLRAKLVFFFLLCCPLGAYAELPARVDADFKVINGVIVMPLGDEYVVDLDASDGLGVGDILTLVTPGKKIIHPDTHEVMGSVNIPTGYLQVTRILSGYSYAKLLSSVSEPKAGAQVSRFEQVPARFNDNAGDQGVLARQLQMDLPQFQWLSPDAAEQALLVFTLEADTLVVKTAVGNLLHKYAVTSDQQLEPPPAAAQPAFVSSSEPKPKPLQRLANSVMSALNLDSNDPFNASNVGILSAGNAAQRGVWMGPNIGGNPVGIAVADLDGDGLQETAIAQDHKLLIAQISQGQYSEKAEVPIKLQILSLDVIDLDNNGRPELYLTALDGFQLSSLVVQFRDGEYQITNANINWFLRVVELPGEGAVLIGQQMDSGEETFFGTPFRVQPEGDKLVRGAAIDLPRKINIYSFVPFTDQENRAYYAYLTKDDYLKVVAADGTEMWESTEYFGGTESCFESSESAQLQFIGPTCIGSRLIKTPNNEILAAQNVGVRIFDRYRKFTESRLVSLSWNGFQMVENWRTAGLKGYLGDYALADADNDGKQQLVMAVKFKHKGLVDPARSAVVTYNLD